MNSRQFGEIHGFPPGSIFSKRIDLSKSKVHRPSQAGICGSATEGAESIVLSGGYNDLDFGDVIIYTGHGGQNQNTKEQISDQQLSHQNMALAKNVTTGLPVRVIRGSGHNSEFSPKEGYRYDGLYSVDSYWREKLNDFDLYKFKLVKIPETLPTPSKVTQVNSDLNLQPKRISTYTTRIIRDTKMTLELKKLYKYRCQICGIQLEGPSGFYIEGAHIKPLGEPHNGPDTRSNIICLCPNHHVLFDIGAFKIDIDFNLVGLSGKLFVHEDHKIDLSFVEYRFLHY